MDIMGAMFFQRREGVVDFGHRRARFSYLESPELDKLIEGIETRFPWIAEEDDDDEAVEGDEMRMEFVLADGLRIFGAGGRFTRAPEEDEGAHPENPIWILEALDRADEQTTRAGEDFVRGFLTTRYELHAGLPERRPIGRARTLRGAAWVDEDGLIRRVTWRYVPYGRPRLERLLRRQPAGYHLWDTCELWDFDVPGPVDLPTDIEELDREPVSNLEFLKDVAGVGVWIWKQRRAWRTHPAA
jgi:hypothetical protein